MRIRNFGFLANRHRAALLSLCFHFLGSSPDTPQRKLSRRTPAGLWKCPQCGGPMIVILRVFSPDDIRARHLQYHVFTQGP